MIFFGSVHEAICWLELLIYLQTDLIYSLQLLWYVVGMIFSKVCF